MDVAVVGATWLLGYVGFIGGSLILAKKPELVHPSIVVFVQPIGYFIAIGSLSALMALINFLMTVTQRPKAPEAVRSPAPVVSKPLTESTESTV